MAPDHLTPNECIYFGIGIDKTCRTCDTGHRTSPQLSSARLGSPLAKSPRRFTTPASIPSVFRLIHFAILDSLSPSAVLVPCCASAPSTFLGWLALAPPSQHHPSSSELPSEPSSEWYQLESLENETYTVSRSPESIKLESKLTIILTLWRDLWGNYIYWITWRPCLGEFHYLKPHEVLLE